MVTDDERREVASRLRLLEPTVFDDGEFYDSWEVLDAIDVASSDGAWYEAAGVRRLADLVEPSCDRDALLELAETMDEEADRLGDAAQRALLPGGGPMAGRIAASRREEIADGAVRDACKWRAAARVVRLACGEEGR